MWTLILIISLRGGLYSSSPAVSMVTLLDYPTEARCQEAAKAAVSQLGPRIETACVIGPRT